MCDPDQNDDDGPVQRSRQHRRELARPRPPEDHAEQNLPVGDEVAESVGHRGRERREGLEHDAAAEILQVDVGECFVQSSIEVHCRETGAADQSRTRSGEGREQHQTRREQRWLDPERIEHARRAPHQEQQRDAPARPRHDGCERQEQRHSEVPGRKVEARERRWIIVAVLPERPGDCERTDHPEYDDSPRQRVTFPHGGEPAPRRRTGRPLAHLRRTAIVSQLSHSLPEVRADLHRSGSKSMMAETTPDSDDAPVQGAEDTPPQAEPSPAPAPAPSAASAATDAATIEPVTPAGSSGTDGAAAKSGEADPAAPVAESAPADAAGSKGEAKKKRERSGGKKRKPGSKQRSPVERRHRGKVVEVCDGKVKVEFGPRVYGTIAVGEFTDCPDVGAEHEFAWLSVGKDGFWQLDRSWEKMHELWKSLEVGSKVEAKVVGENSGGLELRVGPISAFLPASQIDLAPVKEYQPYFGRVLECEILEANRKRRRLVLSRRVLLSRERDAQRAVALQGIEVGAAVEGKVTRLESFGAIVDIGNGLSGLVHVSNLAHERVQHPKDRLSVGQEVRVQVLEIKQGGKKIGLGMKQLETDPWSEVGTRFPVGSRHTGKVVRTTDFGAFVQLAQGIDGLIHISQLAKERVDKVADVVKEGQELLVRVAQIDPSRRRVGLSRLNNAGELLGSEGDNEEDDAAESAKIEEYKAPPAQRGTNLGDVLRRALEGRS